MNSAFTMVWNYIKISWNYGRIIVDILIVAYIFYWIYTFLSRSRAIQIVKGLVIIFIAAVLSKILRLDTLNWLITNLTSSIVIMLIILFQPELRKIITQFTTC